MSIADERPFLMILFLMVISGWLPLIIFELVMCWLGID